MESVFSKIRFLLSSILVDFPVDRDARRFGLALCLFLLYWSHNQEMEISCFTPADATKANAAAFNQYCKSANLYPQETFPAAEWSVSISNATIKNDSHFRIHAFPALYHILLIHCLLIMLPGIWYQSGARCILGNCVNDLLKIIEENRLLEKDLESKFAYEYSHEPNGEKSIEKIEIKAAASLFGNLRLLL